MRIRHGVEESNVDENMKVINAKQIRHIVLTAGKIKSMSGLIDPISHLNLDFLDHRVTECIIAEKFEVGARVYMDASGLLFATVDRSAYSHLGPVNYTQRLANMINAVKDKVEAKEI